MTKVKKSSILLTCLLLALLCGLLFYIDGNASKYIIRITRLCAINIVLALSMNLVNGFTGIFSLGQAGFMLIGAYVYCIFTIPIVSRPIVYQYFGGGIIQFTLPWFVAMFLAGLAAALFAWLIGLPVLRLKSDYLAIATLGFAEIIRAIFQWNQLGPITNGSNMLRLFTIFTDFNIMNPDGTVSVYLATTVPMLIAGFCIALLVLLINSTYGRALRAIKDNEIAAEAMGINLASHKQLAFCISSFFTGISGAMLAMYQTSVQAKSFTSAMTYEILLIVVIGGVGSVTGSCLSSFLFVACSEWWLRFLDEKQVVNGFEVPLLRNGFRLVVFSIIIMIVVLFFRRGIMGTKELPDLFRRRRAKEATPHD